MDDYDQKDLFAARMERDAAMKVATDHADHVLPEWSTKAFNSVVAYASQHKLPFVCDELRTWAEGNGCPVPTKGQAWGSVMARAARERVIQKLGYREHIFSDRSNTHMKPVTLWVAVR